MSQKYRSVRVGLVGGTFGVALAMMLACNTDEISAIESDHLGQATEPIAPANMLKCWVTPDTVNTDPFFQAHPLLCAAVLPASYPLRPKAYMLTVLKKGGGVAQVALGNDQTLELARLLNSDFPVELRWTVRFSSAATETVGSELANYGLRRVSSIASLGQATAGEPLVEKTPFTLWPITLRNASKSYVSLTAADYTVLALPFSAGNPGSDSYNGDVLNVRGQFSTREASRSGVFLAPPSGDIAVRVLSRAVPAGVEGKISGPGTYELVNGALVQVSKNAEPPAPLSTDAETGSDAAAVVPDAARGDAQDAQLSSEAGAAADAK